MIYRNKQNDDSSFLVHHGVKGQKWGVRRYQNPNGTLTETGKKRQEKRMRSDKETTIVKGSKLYRVSGSNKSDAGEGKIYVNTSKKAADFYTTELGSNKIYNTGKAFAHEYIAKSDLKIPSKKTMEKIELGLLKDKKVQRELVDSLMKKGYDRESATSQVREYNAGKAFVQKIGQVATGAYGGLVLGVYPSVLGGMATGNPMAAPIGMLTGAVAGGAAMAKAPTKERTRALTTARISYGDVNNKVTNQTLRNELVSKGYNAMKDYNDRRAYGDKGKDALIVFDSKNNITSTKVSEIRSNDYAQAYARNYLKEHPKTKLEYNDLVKDGEAMYKKYYEQGVIERKRKEENKAILAEDKKKTA